MPSLISSWLSKQLRQFKPILAKMTIEDDRQVQDRIGRLGALLLSGKVDTAPIPFSRFGAEMIRPEEEKRNIVILYLHGGGYTAGSLEYARGFGSVLAGRLGCRVLCVGYRLAPENPFPAALDDAYEAYRYLLLSGYPPEKICLAGESAGGGLIFCLVHRLKAENLPLPGKLIGISPWTDLSLSGQSYQDNRELDPALNYERIAYYAQAYGAGEERNPLVSPIFGEFSDFPPALLLVGSDEILLDDSRALAEKYRQAGRPCKLVVEGGMWHVYVLYAVPESKTAFAEMEALLTEE